MPATPKTHIPQRKSETTYTTAPRSVPRHISVGAEQELRRFPRSGERDPHYGQSRSQWYLLSVACKANNFRPPIKSVSIRRPGALRGVRCYVVASAKLFFQRLLEEQEATQISQSEEKATQPSQDGKAGPQP